MKGAGAYLSQSFGTVQPGHVHTRAAIAAFQATRPLSRPTSGRKAHAVRHGSIQVFAAASATEEKPAEKATAAAPAQRQPANTVPKEKTILLQGDLQELANCCHILFVSRYRTGGNSLSERLPINQSAAGFGWSSHEAGGWYKIVKQNIPALKVCTSLPTAEH